MACIFWDSEIKLLMRKQDQYPEDVHLCLFPSIQSERDMAASGEDYIVWSFTKNK